MEQYLIQSHHPVPCVDAIILNESGEILLIRRDVKPFKGRWTLVGGRVEVEDDNIEHTLIREVKEETGLDVEIMNLAGIIADPSMDPPPDPRFFVVQVFYEVRSIGGRLTVNDEVSEFKWVRPEQVFGYALGFNHNDIFSAYLDGKKNNKLIPAGRRYYEEYFGKNYGYMVQNQYPRFATNAVILNQKKEILLARRIQPPYVGHWDFPGGHLYMNETVEDCLKREIREELGVESEMGELFHVYSDKGKHPKTADVVSYYFASIKSEDFKTNIEMNAFKYFAFDALPEKIAFHNEFPLADIGDAVFGRLK